MRLNVATKFAEKTAGGGAAARMNTEQALRRSVLSHLLWEDEFYEAGEDITARIMSLSEKVPPDTLAALAIEARTVFHLRHVPLLLLSILARRSRGTSLVSETIPKVIRRADELAEFLMVYAKVNKVGPSTLKKVLSAQVKRGLAKAFERFDEYQLAKYDRAGAIRLRDVLFLVHAKAKDAEQDALWKRLIDGKLAVPDTWEVSLSAGADKRETFERLIRDGRLGYLALLRNLRNMEQSGVDEDLVREALLARKGAHNVLPFRFFAAAKAAPRYEDVLDQAMLASLADAPILPGKTVVIVDISGSMGASLSGKSDMTRLTAACALAAILREVCEHAVIYATAGNDGTRKHATALVPARRGMALMDAIPTMNRNLGGGGIFLRQVMDFVGDAEKNTADRIVVITDEQDCSGSGDEPTKARVFADKAYMINVASAKNGIGYGRWTHIDGMSEGVVRFILALEQDKSGVDLQQV